MMPLKKIKITSLFLGIYIASSFSLPAFASDYSSWQKFLDLYLKDGLVNYSAVQTNPALFNTIVSQLENVKKEEYDRWSQDEKKAFWINAYNIEAMKLVLVHYPLKRSLGLQALRYPANSIQQIPDVWNQEALTVLEKEVSLNDIENEILRKEFQDPRIHFAIVCASLGCPVLHDEPYVFDQLDSQLNDAVTKFMQNPKKFNYDGSTNTFYLSLIFKWFKEDFEKAGGSIIFIKKYIPQNKNLPDSGKIQWLEYDWSLNEK
ncbi:MAG: hypothetical protein COV72_02245 [Candidatus Omnitrophica bacterium CG11_big_fil_rev_8_21_14_0_20_42_13]|uniref:DUF547 domain-containing protein n=1 Tax=Candidatus Ghiorseimicrobium undicola TaxID=1974746 RepID=A0A2H0LYY8_9BACT|nr:MAG: hypothetical protein COV72_02245 [Candidatus Omnitrophica bacterium CG11_big_fil_rev_8_21_14_0_20_42_13]